MAPALVPLSRIQMLSRLLRPYTPIQDNAANTMRPDLKSEIIALVREVQALPYLWPSPPGADSARRMRAGSCASKHALLAEELATIGVESQPLFVVGKLVPGILADEPELA